MAGIATTLREVAPRGAAFETNPVLVDDECAWFEAAMREGVVKLRPCDDRCPRFRRSGYRGSDEFLTPNGGRRHLFSLPPAGRVYLNREYIPHIAAYAMAILRYGYRRELSAFSRYRTFERDAITRRAGSTYETDAEFYDTTGSIFLQIEAKKDRIGVERISDQMSRAASLAELPRGTVKEIEYVLELQPRFIWVVGPGSIDPPAHVFAVTPMGRDVRFEPLDDIPQPSLGST